MASRSIRAATVGILAIGAPAFPCSVAGPLRTPQVLVERAALVVHARVEGVADVAGASESAEAESPTRVRFRVLRILKGSFDGDELSFDGQVVAEDDWNDRPVPYDFVRPGGRRGNCFARDYKQGAEYLLLLDEVGTETAGSSGWSPYWAALGPTNEQIAGSGDPWLAWVARQIEGKPDP